MNPQNIPTWSEAINWGIENTAGLKKLAKDTRIALSAVALGVLQACSPANAQTTPETPKVERVAQLQTAQPRIINASVSAPEKLSETSIFSELEELVKAEIPADEQYKYLWTEDRKWYIEQIAANDTPRRSKFKVIMWLGDGRWAELIAALPESYTDIHDTIDNLKSREDNQYVSNLPGMNP